MVWSSPVGHYALANKQISPIVVNSSVVLEPAQSGHVLPKNAQDPRQLRNILLFHQLSNKNGGCVGLSLCIE